MLFWALAANPDEKPAGKATFALSLGADGNLAASVVSSGGLEKGALSCVLAVIRRLKPSRSQGPASARVDITFARQN